MFLLLIFFTNESSPSGLILKKSKFLQLFLANLNPGVLILEEKEDLSYLEQTTSELTCQGKYQFIYSNENMQFNCFLPGVYENL